MATKLITEILSEIDKDPVKINSFKDNGALRLIFEHAFDPAKKFVLPEGEPPYKQDAAPIGMSPANLYMEARKLYVFCRADLTAIRRETLFIQLLENVHPSEAKLLLAIKEQNITKMYPNITHKMVSDTWATIPAPVEKGKPQSTKKSSAPKNGANPSPEQPE
jgi:hypothetical protein